MWSRTRKIRRAKRIRVLISVCFDKKPSPCGRTCNRSQDEISIKKSLPERGRLPLYQVHRRKGKNMVIRTKNLCKYYGIGNNVVKALDNVDIQVEKGEFVGIVGKSGSGKSTLLNMLGCLDSPTSGEVFIGEEKISNLNDEELTKIRRSKIGFIFQNYNLMPVLNTYENVILPVQLDKKKVDKEYIDEIFDILELSEKKSSLPAALSGGQQQRAAIARALANKPEIVLADEPTGNLDAAMGAEVMAMLENMNKIYGQTIIVVTHDQEIASGMKRKITVSDGKVIQ